MPHRNAPLLAALLVIALLLAAAPAAPAQIAVRGETVYTMAGPPITDGVVVITDGKIAAVGPAASVRIPEGHRILAAKIVTPGLIDARATVGLTGMLNQEQDQDQLESSSPIQPELRAIDAYNPLDPLVAWLRGFGITSVHTGHAPGELISGQTMVVKTVGQTVEAALVKHPVAVASTYASDALKRDKSPGTRAKAMSMFRAELLKAQEYDRKLSEEDESKRPARDLRMEALASALRGEAPLLITVDRAQDIAGALRLAAEFDLKLMIDSGAESYMLLDELRDAGFPVLVHPLMARAYGDRQNMSFTTPAKLREAGITIGLTSGFEGYVPKVRVVLFEAAIAAANGLSFEDTLRAITIDAARILGVDDRIGSLEAGKDGDVALYDGDPFEYTTHCIGVVIDGVVVSEEAQ